MDCTTTGRFSIEPHPDFDDYSPIAHTCSDGYWYTEAYERYVEVGDYCGAVTQNTCTVCPNRGSGRFSPWTIESSVSFGDTFVDTITVSGTTNSCPGRPLCGANDGDGCLGSIEASEPWLHFDLVSRVASPASRARAAYTYRITVDSNDVGAGPHSARLVAVPDCAAYCSSTCMQLDLTVEGPVDTPEQTASTTDPYFAIDAVSPMSSDEAMEYQIEVSVPGRVTVDLIGVDGRHVVTLLDRVVAAGRRALSWSPQRGALSAGVYFLRLATSAGSVSQKLVVTPGPR